MSHRISKAIGIGTVLGMLLVLLFACVGCSQRVTHAHYDKGIWTCPHGTDTVVDTSDERMSVYCAPQTPDERHGVR
jgi:hypothetical protein